MLICNLIIEGLMIGIKVLCAKFLGGKVLILQCFGLVIKKDDFVYYLHNISPLHVHDKNGLLNFQKYYGGLSGYKYQN